MMYAACLLVIATLVGQISGHGYMLDPPSRSSLWRVLSSAQPNYNDNFLACGGMGPQWNQFGGKCGLCGDAYGDPRPRKNENTGEYGKGIVYKTYKSGETIPVTIQFEPNHRGYFNFSLCVLSNPNAPEPDESCFQPLTLGDGSQNYPIAERDYDQKNTINTNVKLPDGLRCDRCVLRWHYRVGTFYGQCDDGSSAVGCGPQETYRNCADIAIQ